MKLLKGPFKRGDKVTSDFYPDEKDLVRTVTSCIKHPNCQSGWRITADAGEPCPCCNRPGKPIIGAGNNGVDSEWFQKKGG